MLNPLNIISKFIKSGNQKELDRIQKIVEEINLKESKVSKFEDNEFPLRTNEFISRLKEGEKLNDLLPEAFALVREASKRINNERHFDVQLIGGIALHENKIAEMKTGEGKTLTIVLAAYLNALEKKGVHIVTVNDYLAKRDSINMGKIYNFLGLSCGYINSNQSDEERKENYNKDITYATNSELGFDFLRDNMKYSKNEMVLRKHNFAIVDEIDSCLIDEARTPLVISGAAEDKTMQYIAVDKLIKNLKQTDFDLDEKEKNILLTNEGIDNVEKIFSDAGILKNNNFYDPENLHLVHHVNQALRANYLFENGRDYIVKDNEIIIIDEQTGRQLPGRRFGDGLHQSLEAKEKIEVKAENQTLASITYQNFFKLYDKLAGCTGTAQTESAEFFEIYNLPVLQIPTNKEMIRNDLNDQIFRTGLEKDNAIIQKIKECNEIGQPLLVFTSSINKSEHYSNLLEKEKIKHIVLNAKNHEKEAEIIANAGKTNSVIITTSISGRGVDIKLGGQDQSEKEDVKKRGGLFVIGTERMESRRVDNQAQQKVEARNFDIRKTLIKFDNVLNDQRHVIFEQRKNVIDGKEDENYSDIFLEEVLENLKRQKILHEKSPNSKEFPKALKQTLGKSITDDELGEILNSDLKTMEKKIKDKFINNRDERNNLLGIEQGKEIEKRILVQIIDQNWKSHIQYLEQLRQVIGLRSYGQRDPLVEYKKEAFLLFENLLGKLKTDLVTMLLNLKIIQKEEEDNSQYKVKENLKSIAKSKIGRNEPCPCGSGKKYKHCCGAL